MTTSFEDRWNGKWRQLKGRVRHAWGDVTDDDVERYHGSAERLVGWLEEKTGETREAIERKIDEAQAEREAERTPPSPPRSAA